MAENCIEACLESLEKGLDIFLMTDNIHGEAFRNDEIKHHFMKFETIAMQAISLLFSDSRSEQWPRELLIRICEHCIKILHRWKLKTNPRETEQLSRIPMSFNSSALLFTITILVKASQMHRGHFLHRYVDYWLNESNLLLKVIKHLVHVKFDDDGNQFLAEDTNWQHDLVLLKSSQLSICNLRQLTMNH
jgi:hypothetical protein